LQYVLVISGNNIKNQFAQFLVVNANQFLIMKIILPVLFVLLQISALAQPSTQYDNIFLNNPKEYRKAEPQVILAADYVYASPIDKDNLNRQNAISFIMRWMSGTPDYSFTPDKAVMKITNNDNEVLGVYFACLAKYALEKGKGVDREELKINSYKLLAIYCENPDNNYKPRGEIKKLIEAKNQNKLVEYLEAKEK